jgi:uncharacterized protein
MAKSALELSREEWRSYNPSMGLGERQRQRGAHIETRKVEALDVARKAAHLLRKNFGAKRVLLFGSLAREEWFGPWSDIDLAAQGILAESFYSAVAWVTGLSASFRIDLIDMDECRPTLRKVMEEEGIDI